MPSNGASRALCHVAFLDRDGVINAESDQYIKSLAEFHLLPGAVEALCRLTAARWRVVVVTNQSAVQRGLIARRELGRIHDHLRRAVAAAGGTIDDILYCPHGPDDGCDCRKPRPGMLQQARQRHHIDLSRSVMIGDSVRDIQCGVTAGCGRTILVRTGNGRAAETLLGALGLAADHVAEDLAAAVAWLLKEFPC